MYAATHPYTVDENGNRKYVYCHWGVVDENNKFIPGKRYVFASLEERERLIFPDDWDMSEAKRLSEAKQPGQTANPLCRTNPELVCAPHMEVNRPA